MKTICTKTVHENWAGKGQQLCKQKLECLRVELHVMCGTSAQVHDLNVSRHGLPTALVDAARGSALG